MDLDEFSAGDDPEEFVAITSFALDIVAAAEAMSRDAPSRSTGE
jgi:hypothetical protein